MELTKTKYKQTEVGMIPIDWEVSTLDEVTTLMTNGFVGTATTEYTEERDGVLYIQGYNVEANSFNFNGIKRVNQSFHKRHLKSTLKEGDLLTVQTGDVGLTTIVSKELEGSNCHALIISRFKSNKVYPWFYAQYFNSYTGRSRLKELEIGTTMKHLNVGDMKNWQIPLPPTLTEQKAIATALSDVDDLIANLDKLITKKKAIKQGAMQQLLAPPQKGGKRLAGFTGEWVEKKLGDIGDVQMCKRIFSYQTTKRGDVPFFKIGTFGKEPDAFISWELYNDFRKKYSFPKKGFLLISASGTIGRTVEYKGEDAYYQDSNIIWIENDGKLVTNEYLKYIFKVINYNTEGSTIKRLYNSIVKSASFYRPPSLEEQKAIAQILTDMDSEIEQLESKKAKYQDIKQGMMQELLTGKTRLV